MKLLVLCTGNSCRSQMAEGFLKHYAQEKELALEVVSAGVETHGLNPKAVKVMGEVGIDISEQTSDLVDDYLNSGVTHLFSVCDHAKESCPVFPEQVEHIHYSFPDPAQATGDEETVLNSFRATRNEIRSFSEKLINQLAPNA